MTEPSPPEEPPASERTFLGASRPAKAPSTMTEAEVDATWTTSCAPWSSGMSRSREMTQRAKMRSAGQRAPMIRPNR